MQTMWNRPLLLGHGYGVYLLFLLVMIAPTTGWSEGSFAGEIKGVKGGYANFVLIRDGIRQQLKSTIFLRVGDKIYPSNKCSGNASLSLSFSSGKDKETLKCDSPLFRVETPKSCGVFCNFWNWVFSSEGRQKITAVSVMSQNKGSLRFPMLENKTAILFSTVAPDSREKRKELHLGWEGGTGIYTVKVFKEGKENTPICKGKTDKRVYTCGLAKPLTKGDYKINIIEKEGNNTRRNLSLSFKVVNPDDHKLQCTPKFIFEFYQQVTDGQDIVDDDESDNQLAKRFLKRGEIKCKEEADKEEADLALK